MDVILPHFRPPTYNSSYRHICALLPYTTSATCLAQLHRLERFTCATATACHRWRIVRSSAAAGHERCRCGGSDGAVRTHAWYRQHIPHSLNLRTTTAARPHHYRFIAMFVAFVRLHHHTVRCAAWRGNVAVNVPAVDSVPTPPAAPPNPRTTPHHRPLRAPAAATRRAAAAPRGTAFPTHPTPHLPSLPLPPAFGTRARLDNTRCQAIPDDRRALAALLLNCRLPSPAFCLFSTNY